MQQIILNGIVPLVLTGKLPMVSVKINGEEKQFLLDNGVPTLVLNSRYENNSGGDTPVKAFSSSGEALNVKSTFVAVFECLDIRLENQLALVMDLSHFEKENDVPVHGIVGYSVMMNHELLINYRDNRLGLFLLPEDPPNLIELIAPSFIGGFHVLPIQMAHHFPLVSMKIGGKTVNMAVNMGSCVNILKKGYMKDFEPLGLLQNETPSIIRGLGTIKETPAYRIKSSLVGVPEEMDMLFAFDDLDIPGAAVDGTLGYEFFKRVPAIIRFNRREMLIGTVNTNT